MPRTLYARAVLIDSGAFTSTPRTSALIPHPNTEARKLYLKSLTKRGDGVDLDKWAKDTKGLSLAHLKELFVATSILGNPYERTLKELLEMKETPSSVNDDGEFTFGTYA